MASPLGQFGNVVLCDDVREELRNKKSLMGVYSGDITVAEIPAQIFLALYVEYFPTNDGKPLKLSLRLMLDNNELVKAEAALPEVRKVASLVLPRALVRFEKETKFSVLARVNDGAEQEILSKRVIRASIS